MSWSPAQRHFNLCPNFLLQKRELILIDINDRQCSEELWYQSILSYKFPLFFNGLCMCILCISYWTTAQTLLHECIKYISSLVQHQNSSLLSKFGLFATALLQFAVFWLLWNFHMAFHIQLPLLVAVGSARVLKSYICTAEMCSKQLLNPTYLFILTTAVFPAFFKTWSHSSSFPRILYLKQKGKVSFNGLGELINYSR